LFVRILAAFALRKNCFCSAVAIAYFPSLEGLSLPFVARPNPNLLVRQSVLREQERFRHYNISVGVAMGLAAASSTVLFAQKAAASPGDEAAPHGLKI
jgi:hypothetical protein